MVYACKKKKRKKTGEFALLQKKKKGLLVSCAGSCYSPVSNSRVLPKHEDYTSSFRNCSVRARCYFSCLATRAAFLLVPQTAARCWTRKPNGAGFCGPILRFFYIFI